MQLFKGFNFWLYLGCHTAMISGSAADDPSAHYKEIHLHYKATAFTVYENSSKLVMYCQCVSGQSLTQTIIKSNIYKTQSVLD